MLLIQDHREERITMNSSFYIVDIGSQWRIGQKDIIVRFIKSGSNDHEGILPLFEFPIPIPQNLMDILPGNLGVNVDISKEILREILDQHLFQERRHISIGVRSTASAYRINTFQRDFRPFLIKVIKIIPVLKRSRTVMVLDLVIFPYGNTREVQQ